MTEKAYESVTFGEAGTGVLEIPKVAIEGIWRFSEMSIDNFPCEDLRTIDQLWVKYSNGRFGFSVQKRIYQSLGGTRSYDPKVWEAFGDQVGWRVGGSWLYYSELEFNQTADISHLPWVDWLCFGGWDGVVLAPSFFASRLVDCNI
ncbi:GUN4 domain-containing protein [Planktothrix pseudagardhii]|uniref:GUN4-like domain-containing protein n=1 Tax=Planktothrix pseudagardhii TaxID=132604 RepID=A0A9W4CMQ1_9CYAN|nr:putative protein ycf53 [Planktothrix pseudagardhii]